MIKWIITGNFKKKYKFSSKHVKIFIYENDLNDKCLVCKTRIGPLIAISENDEEFLEDINSAKEMLTNYKVAKRWFGNIIKKYYPLINIKQKEQ